MEMSDFTPTDVKEHHPSAIGLHCNAWPGAECILDSRSDGISHLLYAAKRDSTKSVGENSMRSSIFSPTPTKRIGIFNSLAIAVTTPPLAVPSNLLRIKP